MVEGLQNLQNHIVISLLSFCGRVPGSWGSVAVIHRYRHSARFTDSPFLVYIRQKELQLHSRQLRGGLWLAIGR